jgi:hypothetical protein
VTDTQQERKIKCPYCGWIRTVPVSVIVDESTTDAVRGAGDTLREVGQRIRSLLADRQLDAANAWIDMPACPHCNNVYRYNARTGEVAK